MGEKKVTFPNSMVDRITPVTKPGKVTDVCCEDFIQWVIEDNSLQAVLHGRRWELHSPMM